MSDEAADAVQDAAPAEPVAEAVEAEQENPEFEEIRQDVEAGKEPKASVRELLRWFGARRRRTGVVKRIQTELDEAGIVTVPGFTKVWIGSEITFIIDNEPLYITFNRGPKAGLLSPNADLYEPIFKTSIEKAISLQVWWLPSHTDDDEDQHTRRKKEIPPWVKPEHIRGN